MSLASTWNTIQWLWRHRWSVLTVFLAAIPATYAVMPDDWLPAIPQWVKTGLAVATMFSAGAQAVTKIVPKDPPA